MTGHLKNIRRHALRTVAIALLAFAANACNADDSARAGSIDEGEALDLGFMLSPEPAKLPPLAFTDGEARPLTEAFLAGRVVLLNIWATWCGPCREEMPALDALQAQLGSDDFEVVALSIDRDGLALVERFYKQFDIESLGIYNDPTTQAATTLGVLGIPTTLLLDRQGREIARSVGAKEWDAPEMIAFLQDVIVGTPSQAQLSE